MQHVTRSSSVSTSRKRGINIKFAASEAGFCLHVYEVYFKHSDVIKDVEY